MKMIITSENEFNKMFDDLFMKMDFEKNNEYLKSYYNQKEQLAIIELHNNWTHKLITFKNNLKEGF